MRRKKSALPNLASRPKPTLSSHRAGEGGAAGLVFKTYSFRLYPNAKQTRLLSKHFGCARFIYNWALAIKKNEYEFIGTSPSWVDLCKKITPLKKETYWLREVSLAPLQSLEYQVTAPTDADMQQESLFDAERAQGRLF